MDEGWFGLMTNIFRSATTDCALQVFESELQLLVDKHDELERKYKLMDMGAQQAQILAEEWQSRCESLQKEVV